MIRSLGNTRPQVAATAYVDESAQVIGDVTIGEHASIWPGAVLRGDMNFIRIGAYSNIQDNCVVHVDFGPKYPCIVEDNVTVGHRVILHGCHVESNCLIGMGSVILNGARIGAGSIIAAGAVVPEHAVIPPGSLCMGVPAVVRRAVRDEERKRIENGAQHYAKLKDQYLCQGTPAVHGSD